MSMRPEEHWDKEFMKEFEKESDRACVILSVAMLDHALETLLKAYLVPISASEDNLFESVYAPVSSFNAKIDLAHRLGLISTQFCRDLHTIRRIRNDFAHNITECSFQNVSIHSRVDELCRASRLIEKEPEVRESFQSGTRGDFQMHVSCWLWHLNCRIGRTSSIKPANPEPAYWSKEQLEAAMLEAAKKAPGQKGEE